MKRFVFVLVVLEIVSGLAQLGVPRVLARPIKLDLDADMGFGEVFVGEFPGTVAVSPSGTRTAQGDITLGSSAGVAAAQFTVTGEKYLTYAITLPESAALTAGGNSMTLDTFLSLPSGSGVLDGNGQQTFTVGATLHIVANQPYGAYSGSYSVTVSYN